MLLIIGLGNPGTEYENTRHNLGREIVAQFGKKHGFNDFRRDEKLKALVTEGKIGKERYSLVLPETFMNKSGETAKRALLFYKTKPERIFVVHDDADIPLGRTKLSFARDSAGHKGVESVMRGLSSKKFWRFRIGIGAPPANHIRLRGERKRGDWSTVKNKRKKKHTPAEDLVLKKFSPAETVIAKKVRAKTISTLGELSSATPEKVMNHYNK